MRETMKLQDFNRIIKEDNKMSDIVTAHGLLGNAIQNPRARQEYFNFMMHLRNKHGIEYSTRVHQQATGLSKSVNERSIDEDAWTGDNPSWNNGSNQWNDGTNQWHGSDSGEGSRSVASLPVVAAKELEEDFNPQDVVTVDIPLLIRLLEYAREDAKTDMDLHNVTERLIALSHNGNTLTMKDYNAICNKETN